MVWLLLACAASPEGAVSAEESRSPVPWTRAQPRIGAQIDAPRDWRWARSIVHLHSPWSHDACDGAGYVDGQLDESCLANLREGLCEAAVDVAWLTDHPAYAASVGFESLLLSRDGDTPVELDGEVVGFEVACADGSRTLWRPGIEDELMPVGMERHVDGDATAREALLNRSDGEAIAQMEAAGGLVLQAHTEGQTLETLRARQELGLAGVEMFNLHAMVDPTKREEDLGLDPWSWLEEAAPFTAPGSELEPDLVFLTFYEAQAVSLSRWDSLSQLAPTVGVAGTDAHENALPVEMSDGDRMDSYRRMMRWFSNWLLIDETGPAAADAALAAGRVAVVFDVLGIPEGLDFHLEAGGTHYEMGQTAPEGELVVGCPSLSPISAQGAALPEITTRVIKDNMVWRSGCGRFETEGPGIYRVEVDILPLHYTEWLVSGAQGLMRPHGWIYTNPIRVR